MHFSTLASLALAALGVSALVLQDKNQERFAYPKSKDADGGMGRWMATMKPGPAHARLAELLGSYDWTKRLWMAPGQPAMEEKGTAEFSWLVEGKWLQEHWSGQMFNRPATGTTILGYDNFKERYVSCTVDSMQTTIQSASGLFDQSGTNLTLWGTIDEPATPEQDKQVKYVYRGFGQDKFVFEVHDMMIGESNTKVVEIEFVRRK